MNEGAATVGGCEPHHGCEFVRLAKCALKGFEIFEPDPIDHVGMMLDLAQVRVQVAVKCVDTYV